MAIISAVIALVCHAIALEARILPDGDSGQNLSLLNVGSLVSLMICTVMTIVASRNRGWLLLPLSMPLRLSTGAGNLHAQ